MSLFNPTLLRVGLAGRLDGLRQTVTARVVLSTVVKGDTYYWNEYYLADEDGAETVLVFEEDHAGYVWRWFKDYVPLHPPAAAWAASRRLGERIDLTGEDMRVTLISQSLVRLVEGRAPAGVELNDLANYFNAEKSGRMLVVSWTGEEVDCYLGEVLSAGQVAQAFGLSSLRVRNPATASATNDWNGGTSPSDFWNWVVTLGAFALVGLVIAAVVLQEDRIERAAPATRQPANTKLLALGSPDADATGRRLRVQARAVVEVGRLGRNFDHNEYLLSDPSGKPSLLVEAPLGDPSEWCLAERISAQPLDPLRLGALKAGQSIEREGRVYGIRELQVYRSRKTEGADTAGAWSSEPRYGLLAHAGEDWLLLRWDERNVWCYRGRRIDAKSVNARWTLR